MRKPPAILRAEKACPSADATADGHFAYKISEFDRKPSSVVCGHLSRRIVADALKRYSRHAPGGRPIWRMPNLAPDGVCTARRVAAAPVSSCLPFPSLQLALRSVSVALSLESPPPDVIRRPALRCSDFPHGLRRAAAKSTRTFIIPQKRAQSQLFATRLGKLFFLQTLVFCRKMLYNISVKILEGSVFL